VIIAGSFSHLALVWQRYVDRATPGPAMGQRGVLPAMGVLDWAVVRRDMDNPTEGRELRRYTAHLLVDLHEGQRNAKE